jgi:cytochrome c oxidase subunit IV
MSSEGSKPRATAAMLWRRNALIWAALLLLLMLSLGLAYTPMGLLTPAAGILIAIIKAGLVILLFMELATSKPLIRLTALSGIVFLAALFALTLADVVTRLDGG